MVLEKTIEPTSFIHINMKWTLINALDEYKNQNDYKYRTEAINDLLEFALKLVNKIKNMPPNSNLQRELEELQQQKKKGDIMRYIESLSNSELKTLFELFQDANSNRITTNKSTMKERYKKINEKGIDI